jgi:hypothetical protein
MPPNGPAIKGGCVTRRSIRPESWYFSCETVTVQGGYAVPRRAERDGGTRFCSHGTIFIEHYESRGIRLLSG